MRTPLPLTQFDSEGRHDVAVIFSLADDIVWVSWPDKEGAIALGNYKAVTAMMRDFLDQSDLGERLVKRMAVD